MLKTLEQHLIYKELLLKSSRVFGSCSSDGEFPQLCFSDTCEKKRFGQDQLSRRQICYLGEKLLFWLFRARWKSLFFKVFVNNIKVVS